MDIEDQEVDSLTADLAAAWDASEGESDAIELQGNEVSEQSDEPSEVSGDDELGRTPDPVAAESESGVPKDGGDTGQVGSSGQEDEKPPVGLTLEAREKWKDTPAEIKKAIKQREKDYEAGIVKYSQNAKRAQAMDKTLAPYQQLFAMNGGPQNTIPGLLQTASVLQMGSAPQKAQMVAQLIQQFGVDINTLDNILVGEKPTPEVQQQSQFEQMLNQRLQPLQQQLQTYQQQEQQQLQQQQQQIGSELQQFAQKNEFYNDVAAEMADLLEMAANRGRHLSLDEAYRTACTTHPQISKIMQNRQSTQSVEQKRNAASSIRGSAGGTMQSAAPNSITEALEAAWDSVGRM